MDTVSQNDLELFKTLHSLQYDRISKLESQENYIASFVTGLSTITIAFSFLSDKPLTIFNGVFLPLIFIAVNFVASRYIAKTRTFIKMHQKRAEEMRKSFAPNFQIIYDNIGKHDSNNDNFNRTKYLIYLHYLIALVGLCILMKYLCE